MFPYLKHRGLDLSVGEEISETLTVPITDSNVLDEAFLYQRLHRPPSVLNWNILEDHLLVLAGWVMEPFWRISGFKWHKFEADGKVNEVEV